MRLSYWVVVPVLFYLLFKYPFIAEIITILAILWGIRFVWRIYNAQTNNKSKSNNTTENHQQRKPAAPERVRAQPAPTPVESDEEYLARVRSDND